MKSLKPFVIVLAGMLIIIALFSFKNEEPKKEYLTLHYYFGWVITKPDLTQIKLEKEKGDDIYISQVKAINDLAKEGWVLKISSTFSGGVTTLHFERTKQ